MTELELLEIKHRLENLEYFYKFASKGLLHRLEIKIEEKKEKQNENKNII